MDSKFTLLNDVSYGNHERHKVDIFLPEKAKSCTGIILFIHGGGWVEGDKAVHHTDAEFFCNLGYVSASMNYRYVSDNINVFDELDDIAAALEAIKIECAQYGYDIRTAILSGGSAGAHLSLLYAYTRKENASVTPAAVCAYCPPVSCAKSDFLLGISGEFEDWKYEVLSKCCGVTINKDNFHDSVQQTALRKISPEEYVTGNCVPTAVFGARLDELVPLKHVENFVNLLENAGVKNSFLIYENSGHAMDKDPETATGAKEIIGSYADVILI